MLAESFDWGREFRAFTSFHLAASGACVLVVVCVCVTGALLRGTPREARFRLLWGWAVLAYKLAETVFDLWPSRFDIEHSLPLQFCDLGAFVAAGAMVAQGRTWRALLYFWGLGLTPLALLMPTLKAGYQSPDFWLFWVSHAMVIASAMYDVIVNRYRPGVRDFLTVAVWSLGYVAVVTVANLSLGVNYGFIGNTAEGNPLAIERLGPWPIRAFKLIVAVAGLFLAMWAIWPMARRVGRILKTPSPQP